MTKLKHAVKLMKFLRIITTLFVLAVLLAPAAFGGAIAAGPKPEGQTLRWKQRAIRIAVSASLTEPSSNIKTDSGVMNAIRRSVRAWESVADIDIIIEASDKRNVSPSGAAGDAVSLITIAQTPENVLLFSNSVSEPAKTRVFYNRAGNITEADIVLNPLQQFSADGTFGTFDLEATFTHEIGHLLGLGHSSVLSATMSGSLTRNGTFGFADLTGRTLSESDISAVRELYGAYANDETCCAGVSGKITGRNLDNLKVWTEETQSGIVMAQAEAAADGSFRLGGLPAGIYTVYWQSRGQSGSQFEPFELANGELFTLNERVTARSSDISLDYVGTNGQLADSPVNVDAGREYTVFVGGSNLDLQTLNLAFSSPYLSISPNSLRAHDFGSDLSVVSFLVSVNEDAPSGEYSIFASNARGSQAALIGALNIE